MTYLSLHGVVLFCFVLIFVDEQVDLAFPYLPMQRYQLDYGPPTWPEPRYYPPPPISWIEVLNAMALPIGESTTIRPSLTYPFPPSLELLSMHSHAMVFRDPFLNHSNDMYMPLYPRTIPSSSTFYTVGNVRDPMPSYPYTPSYHHTIDSIVP